LSTINRRLSYPSQSWLQKGKVEEFLLILHDLLESKPVVSGVVVWTIHQVFKRIANMAGKTAWLCSTCNAPPCKVNRYSG
jgi:hypothetical protein